MIFSKLTPVYLLLFFSLLSGCIYHDYDNCYGIRLSLKYPGDKERSGIIHIFVFDSDGRLFSRYEKSGKEVKPGAIHLLQLPEGKYTVVVWGGVKERYSFVTDDPVAVRQTVSGSHLESYRMVTALDKGTDVLSQELSPVFHTSEYDIDLQAEQVKELELDFVMNTNKIRVKTTGLPAGVAYGQLDVGIRARNWQYHFDNSVPEDVGEITYIPYDKKIESEAHTADLSVLRLIKGRRPLLYIRDGATGNILYQRNLVELLMNLYTDLDKEDYFEIELDFRGPTIAIKINGWEVIDNNQDIS